MSWKQRPKRKVPRPEMIGPHRATNPLFATNEPTPGFQRRVLGITAAIIGVVVIGLIVEGPWWQISSITVSGVHDIDPRSVETVMQRYVYQRRWLIIPNRNLAIFSTSQAEHHLQKKIEERISVDAIEIKKIFPNGLHVRVTERTVVAYAKAESHIVALDRLGTIIEVTTVSNPDLPVLEIPIDQSIGQRLLEPSVMTSVTQLHASLREASIPIQSWTLPLVTCPVIAITPETNTNEDLDTSEPVNENTNQDANVNQPRNTNTRPNPFTAVCRDAALKQTRPEIHVQVVNGPRVLFDRFQNLPDAVQRVRRILAQPEPPREYIDVRFGERVFVK